MSDEIIDEIIADLVAGLINASDEEINAKLDSYDLTPEDREDILETVKEVRQAEALADENTDPINIDTIDKMADAAASEDSEDSEDRAQQMANEDNTEVTVTEEDKDNDGDVDKTVIEKEDAENDAGALSDEDKEDIDTYVNSFGNASEDEDNPHDTIVSDARMKNIINTLSQFKY